MVLQPPISMSDVEDIDLPTCFTDGEVSADLLWSQLHHAVEMYQWTNTLEAGAAG